MPPERVDIVVPVYRNRDTLRDLYRQVLDGAATAGYAAHITIVDDACPDRSGDMLTGLEATVLRHAINQGQQAAIRRGIMACGGHPVIVMDADLQDPPEAIPLLLAALRDGGFDAVFATRRGRYQSVARSLSGRAFRSVVRGLVPLPAGAGGYVALAAPLVQRLQSSGNPRFYLAGLVGCHARSIGAIAIDRRLRPAGHSSYTGAMRWSTGISNIRCILHEKSNRPDVDVPARGT